MRFPRVGQCLLMRILEIARGSNAAPRGSPEISRRVHLALSRELNRLRRRAVVQDRGRRNSASSREPATGVLPAGGMMASATAHPHGRRRFARVRRAGHFSATRRRSARARGVRGAHRRSGRHDRVRLTGLDRVGIPADRSGRRAHRTRAAAGAAGAAAVPSRAAWSALTRQLGWVAGVLLGAGRSCPMSSRALSACQEIPVTSATGATGLARCRYSSKPRWSRSASACSSRRGAQTPARQPVPAGAACGR